ncbi:histidine kinase [Frankia sp. AiPs1]|uniref:hybrid sensor histidine kinase/response regulator n=1 Tax=Frankia sp. AiPa1 TaxID=573492 RepID=UPI00202B8556|nr:hybrid sensor histidine kinase/response regulator [Frankia sp. AiPa1]MCL9761099.1 hybrid sensor histidine kinase/response regulator [Frankia sp. AiPa1]
MGPRTLLDALTDLAVVVGADGRVIDMGAATEVFLAERVPRDPQARDLVEVVDPAFRVALIEAVTAGLAHSGQWRGSVGLITSAGVTVPHHVTVRRDPDGGLVIVARDTSDQRAREVAENESRAKDELIARLGHELRTPLNAMLGFAQLLELEPLTPDLHDDVERIITGGRHMQALIDDVLDLARLRAGRGDITNGPVNVLDIVKGVVELVEPLAAQRSIRRAIHPAEPLVADADRRRLWQVLLNLVGNALKYGREGGCVRVGIVPITGSRIRIEVEDDGVGLSPRAIDRLFRPFERLGAERSGIEGSGLGLALSHALVTAMGGVLTVASRHGVGSVFAVVLDAVDMRFEDPDADDDGFGDAYRGSGSGGYATYGGAGHGGSVGHGASAHGRSGYGGSGYGGSPYGGAGYEDSGSAGGSGGAWNGRPATGTVSSAQGPPGNGTARTGSAGMGPVGRATPGYGTPAHGSAPAALAPGSAGWRAAPDGLRVVHVSGDPAVRSAVAQALAETLGADTVTVPRAGLALDAVRRARPAFVLMDQNLPDASTAELLAQLASDPIVGAVPAFVLAEDVDSQERAQLRRDGAVDVLDLPLTPASLTSAASALTATVPAHR